MRRARGRGEKLAETRGWGRKMKRKKEKKSGYSRGKTQMRGKLVGIILLRKQERT